MVYAGTRQFTKPVVARPTPEAVPANSRPKDDVNLTGALAFTGLTLLNLGAVEKAKQLVQQASMLFDSALPFSILGYATEVVRDGLDSRGAERRWESWFSPEEKARAEVRLIRLSLVTVELPKTDIVDPAKIRAAIEELEKLCLSDNPSVANRAQSILADAGARNA